jgi:hypothetical protein
LSVRTKLTIQSRVNSLKLRFLRVKIRVHNLKTTKLIRVRLPHHKRVALSKNPPNSQSSDLSTLSVLSLTNLILIKSSG